MISALANRTVPLLPAVILVFSVLAILFGGAAILGAWADARKQRRRLAQNVLVACERCGQMVPEDLEAPGYPQLHRCQPDVTGHQRMEGDDE